MIPNSTYVRRPDDERDMFKAVKRGNFSHVTRADGSAVRIRLENVVISRAPYESAGKTYVRLDASAATSVGTDGTNGTNGTNGTDGTKDDLLGVRDFIRATANPRFDPLIHGWTSPVIAKIPPATKNETPVTLTVGDIVSLTLAPGAFGSFGWCILATDIRPVSS